jgi:diguanylate cyclase (GGDEF)-like protein
VQDLALCDQLTGALNRRGLEARAQEELARARRHRGQVTLLYLDLDGFKDVNDRGGHDAGDHLLREVAARLQQGVRQGDLVARVGGDEFVALLPGCRDARTARAVAETLRARLTIPFSLPDGLFRLDASIGIACFPDDGANAKALLAQADRAMYAVKHQQSSRESGLGESEENSADDD